MAEVTIYKPQLRYCFCLANQRSLWPQGSLICYLNKLGITPYVVAQLIPGAGDIIGMLKGCAYKLVSDPDQLPKDYDVMFSQSAGLDAFETACLQNSYQHGKKNIKVHNSLSTYNTITNINYTRERVRGRLHGFCMKDQRSIEHFKRFLPEPNVWYLNCGDPDWDYLQTPEFTAAVAAKRAQYGDKLLLICASFDSGKPEAAFWSLVVPWALDCGYRVLIRPHPGCEHHIPEQLQKYAAPPGHRHVWFAAASHVIAEMASSVIGECMLLHTRVASYPFAPSHVGYGRHAWLDNKQLWTEAMLRQVGAKMLMYVPYVHTSSTLKEFLAGREPLISDAAMDRLWGWPRVPSYSAYLFKQVEQRLHT